MHCSGEIDNPHDDQAVSVIHRGVTVGHMPRYICVMRFFAISTARREYYCYCHFNQKIFKRPSTRRIRNSMSIHAGGANQ